MIDIFESVLPIFLLVLLGALLKRRPQIDGSMWKGLEQLGYYLLFPALLINTLHHADFASLTLGAVTAVTLLAFGAMMLILLALWPLLQRLGVDRSRFSSVFQTASRWNAFIALAIAEELLGKPGLALIALVMAVIVLPLNFFNVLALVWFGNAERSVKMLLLKTATNPIIIGCLIGLSLRVSPVPLYQPLDTAIDLVSRSSLVMGLIIVGAGLRIEDALRPSPVVLLPVFLKLVLFPALMLGLALAFGIRGEPLVLLVLCAAVPTAMNGFVLARQMGGDAPLYAAVTTLQTFASFFTIPIVLAVANYFAG